MRKYPHERQIEFWTSAAIERFFRYQGYFITVLPNTSLQEKDIPYDHLFAGKKIKVFALQYKRLHPGNPDFWEIDIDQLSKMSKYPWIFYALSDVRSVAESLNALHYLLISPSDSVQKALNGRKSKARLRTSDNSFYYRWGGFVRELFSCNTGWLMDMNGDTDGDDISTLLSDDIFYEISNIYLLPTVPGPAIAFGSQATQIEKRDIIRSLDEWFGHYE